MTFKISPELETKIEELAERLGFDSVEAYLISVVEEYSQELDDEDEPDPRIGLREGLRELRQGLSYPYEQVWDMIENDAKD
ncbi:MAG: hypothetical protein K8L97_11220 [Anaerolineae bacterium]|nr:hypothetical protein [Anaerolineae bacterium]